jgi:hypothetical protein
MRQNALEEPSIRSGSIANGSERDAQPGAGISALGAGAENALRASIDQGRADLEKRFPLAMAMYVVLAVLVWFTMDAGKVNVVGKPVDLRLVPLIVIGGLALRTVLARQAERIRTAGEKGSS